MIRKLHRNNGYSFFMFLPCDWVKKNDYPLKVEVIENEGELTIRAIR